MTRWVWPKSLAEYQLNKYWRTSNAVCIPAGKPIRQQGINYYASFTCGVTLNNGAIDTMTITPKSRVGFNITNFKAGTPRASATPPTITPPAVTPPTVTPTGPTHWILSVDALNRIVKLEDGSVWRITDIASYKLALWLPIDHISIQQGTIAGTYVLVDLRRGDALSAQYLGR